MSKAAAPEPVAVLSSASYDRWYDNVALLGALSGSPDLAQGLESMLKMATANRGLAGLDKKRPWAAVVVPRGPVLGAYLCLPVDRLDALLDMARPLVENVVRQGNLYEVRLRNGARFLAAQRGPWAVVAFDSETIGLAVADPMPLLGDLPQRYDLAARLHVSRLSPAVRAMILAYVDQRADTLRRPGETDSQYQVRRQLNRLMAEAVRTGLGELDRLTVGVVMDRSARRATTELTLVPKRGTPIASRWAQYRKENTLPAGFRLPEATVTASWAGPLPPKSTRAIMRWFEEKRGGESLFANDYSEPKDLWRTKTPDPFSPATEAIRGFPIEERLEGSASAVLHANRLTWVSAMRLPADHAFRRKLQRYVAAAQNDPDVRSRLERAADRDGEVRVYVLARRNVAPRGSTSLALVGPEITAVFGFGKEYFYLAMGRGALATLQEALAVARSRPMVQAAPVEGSVALHPLAAMAALRGEGELQTAATQIAAALEQPAGKDHVRWRVDPIDEGIRVRVEVEEGILGAASLAAALWADSQSRDEP